MSDSRLVCPWCGHWCKEGPRVIDGRIHCRECAKRFFLADDGATTWPESPEEKRRAREIKAECLLGSLMPFINPTPWDVLKMVFWWVITYPKRFWKGK
jgi:hypothetical protein